MFAREDISDAVKAASPIMLGYVAIGIPCGILSASIGLSVLQVLIMCVLFYSGAGQFMIPNMWLAGSPVFSIIASVSFVNTRQMLYSAAFAPWCTKTSKAQAFWFAATVTDESFGVNLRQFQLGNWTVSRATLVNLFSQLSWTAACVVGVFIGNALDIPLPIAAFAMTSIFICLLVTQESSVPNVIAAVSAAVGVLAFKAVGLSGPAIFLGALLGVACAFAFARLKERF